MLLDEGKPNERTVTVALPGFAPADVFDRSGNGEITTNEVERALTGGLGIPPPRASVEDGAGRPTDTYITPPPPIHPLQV